MSEKGGTCCPSPTRSPRESVIAKPEYERVGTRYDITRTPVYQEKKKTSIGEMIASFFVFLVVISVIANCSGS